LGEQLGEVGVVIELPEQVGAGAAFDPVELLGADRLGLQPLDLGLDAFLDLLVGMTRRRKRVKEEQPGIFLPGKPRKAAGVGRGLLVANQRPVQARRPPSLSRLPMAS